MLRHVLTPSYCDALTLLARTRRPVSVMLQLWAGQVNGLSNAAAANVFSSTEQDHLRFHRVTELLDHTVRQELMVILPKEWAIKVGGPFPAAVVTGAVGVEVRPSEVLLQSFLLATD